MKSEAKTKKKPVAKSVHAEPGKDEVLKSLRAALEGAGGDAELLFISQSLDTTRFAANGIHQNMSERDVTVSARAAVGKKLASVSVNSLAKADLRAALKRARQMAAAAQPAKEWAGFPGPQSYGPAPRVDEATARQSPLERAGALAPLFKEAGHHGTELHGALSARHSRMAVVNSEGLEAWHEGTVADAQLIAMDPGGGGSGYAADADRRFGALDLPTLAETAIRKCVESRNPKDLEPGTYEVILEPAAVAEIFSWLPWIAFTGRSVEDGLSFLKDRFGQRVAADWITIYDDGLDADGIVLPFDFEGRPKQTVHFIDKGVAREVAHDFGSAARARTKPTGHAPPPGAPPTAAPMNIFIAPGMSCVEEMIAQTNRGVLVTRFHYLNGLLNPPIALFTGMTRDGAFWVEDGKVRYPIKNMRFTQSIAKALHAVELVARERVIAPSTWSAFGSACVPALKIREFCFSSRTEF
ncbi:MAG: TldD/PmbA family protein [Planctomycetes bacterium]|nr:TldD/PmbA family protein [Planctomycetota bacterium]